VVIDQNDGQLKVFWRQITPRYKIDRAHVGVFGSWEIKNGIL